MRRACRPPADGGGLMLVKPNRDGSAIHQPGGPPAARGGLMPIKRNRVGCATRALGSPPADGAGLTPIKPNGGGSATSFRTDSPTLPEHISVIRYRSSRD